MANHASTRTTKLYDCRLDEVSLYEVERIVMTPTAEQLEAGSRAFQMHEPRDAMYRTAAFLVELFGDNRPKSQTVSGFFYSPGTKRTIDMAA
jgi:hypothetical protein